MRALNIELNATLKSTVSTATQSTHRSLNWGKVLVISQVALSVLALFAAGLLVRSLRNLQGVDVGYNREHLLLVRVDPITAGYDTADASARLMNDLRDRVGHLPGVRQVTASKLGLFSGSESDAAIRVENVALPANEEDRQAFFDIVGPDYFSVLGIPVILGREIGAQDTASSPRVAVVNESLAKRFFPGSNPIGRKLWIDDTEHRKQPMEVIGVVKNARDHDLTQTPGPRFYPAMTQLDEPIGVMQLLIRTAGDPAALTNTVRAELKSYNAGLPITSIHSLDVLVRATISNSIVIAKLSSFFGGLALLLACIGLYGVMSYTVAGRTKEIGLRFALGAQTADVLALVMREALLLVAFGVGVGIPVAMVATRLINSMLFGLKNTDPIAMVIVIAMLSAVGALASYIPARRAMKVDPMVALRYE
ncbi:MAG TPA: ABC transporter permease [Terriglobales bacterium]|nr:ABC transporter permease [Terriglobales bacterium]